MRKPISKSLRFSVLRRDGFTCRYCGAKPPEVVLHLDHVLAVANGGTNEESNLVTACLPCNLGKGVTDAAAPEQPGDIPIRSMPRPPIEFFWARDYQAQGHPVMDARCILRPSEREEVAPWEWGEFNRYWHNRTPEGQRHHYSTHGASTAGFSPHEATMYANEIIHMRWASFEKYVGFLDDLITLASLGHIPQHAAPSVLRAVHYESVYERCGQKPGDYEDIADSVAMQAVAAFKPFLDQQHRPWGRK
jgi:hypothetical protein